MRSVFNSLGSNYSAQFVVSALANCFVSSNNSVEKLEQKLGTIFSGTAVGVYKGRDAIATALSVLLPKSSQILTQALSCYAVEEGILRAGMHAVYADVAKNSTNLSTQTIAKAYKKNPTITAVLVQHSLGIPADILQIRKWCTENKILLIEDIAQGYGGTDEAGSVVGTHSDVVICSFGRDKIIDAVSGGAVIFKNLTQAEYEKVRQLRLEYQTVPFKVVLSDLLYPLITTIVRKTHHLGFGKLVFVVSKRLGILSSPIMSKLQTSALLHPAYASLALLSLESVNTQLAHRKQIAQIYFSHLRSLPQLQMLVGSKLIERSSNLRFSFICTQKSDVQRIITLLKNNSVYISDRWYRAAVDCGSFACKTAYKTGSCINGEYIAQRVINLPTHKEISPQLAEQISKKIIELFQS